MSVARIILLAAFVAGMVSGCKQSSQGPQLAPLPAPAPQPSTTKELPGPAPQPAKTEQATAAPGRTTLEPPAAQPAQPPEGMVYVSGGTFDMGPPQAVTMGKAPERVQVAPFFLDRTEVTVAEYLACVRARGCTASKHQPGCNATAKKPRLQHPMNCITKRQAERFCAAQGKRLPSAAEWEFAARGTDGRIYPWGNDAAVEQLCWQGKIFGVGSGRAGGVAENTCPVGSFPGGASPFGALDMAGNVAEWTSTEETTSAGPGSFHTRGGSYWLEPIDLAELETLHIRADRYEPFGADDAIPTLGVRCAKNP
jgi:formylglycine-generating enzyme required for sulfatase activity